MSPVGDITIYESQLFRAYSAPTAADCMSNPGYRPTYSCKHGSFLAAVRDFHSKNSYTNYRSILTKQSSSVYNKLCMKIFADVLRKYSSKSGGKSYETREKTAWQIKDACRLL